MFWVNFLTVVPDKVFDNPIHPCPFLASYSQLQHIQSGVESNQGTFIKWSVNVSTLELNK